MTDTPIHNQWTRMKEKCYQVNNPKYKHHGLLGIKVCKEWLEFINFYNDNKDLFKPGLTIIRIDDNKNFCKDNCIWIDSNIMRGRINTNNFETFIIDEKAA